MTPLPAPLTFSQKLFAAAVFALPFSGVPGVGALGELAHEAAAYLFMLCMAALALSGDWRRLEIPRAFLWFAGLLLVAVAVSWLVNLPGIFENSFRGRSGINKAVTSAMVLVFGLIVSVLTLACVRNEDEAKRLLVKPMLASAAACALVALPEMAAWFSGAAESVYGLISRVVHAGYTPGMIAGRLRSVSYEPPAFALAAGFLFVWLLAAWRWGVTPGQRVRRLLLAGVLMILLLLAGSRTAYLMALVLLLADPALALALRAPHPLRIVPAIGLVVLLAFLALGLLLALENPVVLEFILQGSSVSNLSRYASTRTAFEIFGAHPFVGVGLGQYAFHALPAMPWWGYLSYEVVRWFDDPAATWPPVFSMAARLGAETGLLGLIAWYGGWGLLLMRVLGRMAMEKMETGLTPVLGLAIAGGILYGIAAGFSVDSFRLFGLWLTLGLACRYVSMPLSFKIKENMPDAQR